jgi:hypothetical protein
MMQNQIKKEEAASKFEKFQKKKVSKGLSGNNLMTASTPALK